MKVIIIRGCHGDGKKTTATMVHNELVGKSTIVKMKKHILFFLAMLVAGMAHTQQIKTYEGALNLPSDLNVLGELYNASSNVYYSQGSYQYYENADGDRIKHGLFRFLSIQLGYPNILIEGRYSHGKKEGKWTIKRVNNKGEMVRPHLGTVYNSSCGGFTINYKNDSLSGDYILIGVSESGFYETQYSGKIVNGRIQGKVSFKKTMTSAFKDNTMAKECEMTGDIGSDGLPTGIWTVSDKGGIEKVQRRFFHKGVLVAIDEIDNSTGERSLCYCAFDGQKKIPNMQEIRDSVSDNDSYIIYNGQVAIKINDNDSIDYNSQLGRYSMGVEKTSQAVPSSLLKLSKGVETQVVGWNYVYSEKRFKEIHEQKRLAREKYVRDSIKYVRDSIRREEIQRENAKRELERRKKYVQDSIEREKKILEAELSLANRATRDELLDYMNKIVFGKSMGKIKKAKVDGNEIVFKIDNKEVRCEFKEEYFKNNMGVKYQDNGFFKEKKAIVLSNYEGNLIVLKFERDRDKYIYLVVKEEDGSFVTYELTEGILNKMIK